MRNITAQKTTSRVYCANLNWLRIHNQINQSIHVIDIWVEFNSYGIRLTIQQNIPHRWITHEHTPDIAWFFDANRWNTIKINQHYHIFILTFMWLKQLDSFWAYLFHWIGSSGTCAGRNLWTHIALTSILESTVHNNDNAISDMLNLEIYWNSSTVQILSGQDRSATLH